MTARRIRTRALVGVVAASAVVVGCGSTPTPSATGMATATMVVAASESTITPAPSSVAANDGRRAWAEQFWCRRHDRFVGHGSGWTRAVGPAGGVGRVRGGRW